MIIRSYDRGVRWWRMSDAAIPDAFLRGEMWVFGMGVRGLGAGGVDIVGIGVYDNKHRNQ